MNAKTLTALRGSILKWKKIVNGTGRDKGRSNCPLCQLFYDLDCAGCPVAKKTRQRYCSGTPYELFPGTSHLSRISTAKLELAFLKSLLPKTRKPKPVRHT